MFSLRFISRVVFAWIFLMGTRWFVPGALAEVGGSISGVVTDVTGAVIPGATLTLVSTAQHAVYKVVSDSQGFYSFPSLGVGEYELTIAAGGFTTERRLGLTLHAEAALNMNAMLAVSTAADTVTVTSETGGAQVETIATALGEVVSGAQMRALPLNGRSYTDLLAIQPGVAPVSTLTPSSVIMAGVTGSLDPSGDLNPGNLSINGQRESANGFMVNGIDVQEHMNGGTSVIPNLDSIEEFRVLTNNFDPEYGNYNGGMVTVVSKAGGNTLHGSAFEFFRNTALDARGYFDPTRSAFEQNQFGGTVGGPIKGDKLFFFADFQGTGTTQGISTGDISVPSLAERGGTFDDLTGSVSGPYLASLLTQKLGYSVTSGEAYASVFPHGTIPQSAWATAAKSLLAYIPQPNVGANQYSTSAYAQTVRDDKGSARVDANSRAGQLSGYYFVDDYRLDNPYPGNVGGASLPGFDALFIGRAQVFSLGGIKTIGAKTVNEFHAGYLRNANVVGQPKGGLGVGLASQGFVTGAGTDGIVVQAPQFEGVQNVSFPTFVMGLPITNETQVNNTAYLSEGVSRVFGTHTVKAGVQLHFDQVNEHPNATFNGTFNIDGTETGDPYADLLIGVPSNFTQSSGQPFYLRNRYLGAYVQDSWRARSDLTINAGVRWDVIMPWWEKYNQLQTYVAGQQSVLYPGAPLGIVVAGDPGIPKTVAPTQYGDFAPRLGLAYAPRFESGIGRAIFGASGKSSVRASYGMFYTAFPGIAAGIDYATPPFGLTYLSPGPPLLATPFVTAATGVDLGQKFPLVFPPHDVSRTKPDDAVDWANDLPIQGDPFFFHTNRVAYVESYMLSVQRQITIRMLLTASYVGNQGHRILVPVSANPGSAALCLRLPGCGPFGEDTAYTNAAGQTVQGTRVGQGPLFGETTAVKSIANSNYNGLQTTLRYTQGKSNFLLSYAYAKSIDQGSNIGEQLNPFNARQSRTISAWDQRQTFVASYTLALPVATLLKRDNRATDGWSVSGATRFATGFPVTLYDNSDDSLLGTLGNGVNNYLLDTPRQLAGDKKIKTNGRNGRPAFNTALFPEETLGQLGNARRRVFYGPGINNFDLTLEKDTRLADTKSLEFRIEAFNAFNHAQFYGPSAVDGQVEDPNYGGIVRAAAPRLMQLVAKFTF